MCIISVIIPVKNGGNTLQKCLTAIRQQSIAEDIEIIVLDSMSTDDSKEIAKSFELKIVDIPVGTFNHGLTRNIGVKQAKGDLVYFTTQDAYLAETDQLEKMAAYFSDKEIQSVTGIQAIPKDIDKNPAIWFQRFTKSLPEVRQFTPESFKDLTAQKQLENCNWDNVNAMYRKSALQLLPFQKTDFAEDALWAKDALLVGWRIVRDSSLVVYHYHHQTFTYNFKTTFIVNYTIWNNFKVMPSILISPAPFVRNVYTLLKRKQLSFLEKTGWILHNAVRHITKSLSVATFRVAYVLGRNKLLDKIYNNFCSIIPQGAMQKRSKISATFTLAPGDE